ncbi:GNAT family N-acetyltransferase [Streptomyces sp. NPDC051956]|uniref:GNAT family N-acetyltransferase n=1 Tax=Streptomyces sp. NPDC051956 TaxID=3365677 RepID=UPI0037D05300
MRSWTPSDGRPSAIHASRLDQGLNWDRLASVEQQWAERGHGLCAVELKPTGEFIGRVGLNYWENFHEVELGWTRKAETWGQGYATEAARACLDWGFATLDDLLHLPDPSREHRLGARGGTARLCPSA